MNTSANTMIANSIREFAKELQSAPLVGARIEVTGGGGGPTTGLFISVKSDPSGRSVTGMKINVDADEMSAERQANVETLFAAADALEQGTDKSIVRRLVEGVGKAAGNAGLMASFEKLIGYLE